MIVRLARPEEHERLGRLTVAAYHALPGRVPEPSYDAELADIDAKVAAGCEVAVAVDDDGTVLGGVCFVPSADNPFHEVDGIEALTFRHLAVDPDAQGRGVGHALVAWCVERARALGAPSLLIHSTPWMASAHRLYEGVGFHRAPEHDWVPVPDIPLLAFALEL